MKNTIPLKFDFFQFTKTACRASFKVFVKEFWETVPGAGKLIWNWHMDVICDTIQETAERVFKNESKEHDLIFNVPPGTSKSTLLSILFLPWTWTRMPESRHIYGSHTDNLVFDLADKTRGVLKSEKYQAMFPEIILTHDNVSKITNSLGGERQSCTVAGKSPTGKHAHFLIIDDPIDPKKAGSQAELKTADEFMTHTLSSRKIRTDKDIAVTILIMQRLHYEDPTGLWLERCKNPDTGKVKRISLPAELTDEFRAYPEELEKYYVNGLLDPIRLPRSVLNEQRANSIYAYQGQFGQKPVPPGGSMFKLVYFNNRVKSAPYHAVRRVRFYDRASTNSEDACFTVGVLMSLSEDGNYYVEDVVRGQWEPYERNQMIFATALKDRSKYGPKQKIEIFVEKEGGSTNKDAFQGLMRMMAGFNVKEKSVTEGSKVERADSWSSMLAAGNVYIVETENMTWSINDYIKEHISFPQGTFKDQVDASTGAFNVLASNRKMLGVQKYYFRDTTKKRNVKILLCESVDCEHIIYDEQSILICLFDPALEEINVVPKTGLVNVCDTVSAEFLDLNPADYTATWTDKIGLSGKTCGELIINQSIGKRIWRALAKRRDPIVTLIAIVDDNASRSLSVALGICDVMRLKREETLVRFGDKEWKSKTGEIAPNVHIYDMIKSTREMVI